MSHKLLANNFEWIKDTYQFNEDFIKDCNEEGDERFFLKVDVQYLQKLLDFHNDLPFSLERSRKVRKIVSNLHDKTEYVIHIRNLKQALNQKKFVESLNLIKMLG